MVRRPLDAEMAMNEPLPSNAIISRKGVVRDGALTSCLKAPNRPRKTRTPQITPGTMCHQRTPSQATAATSTPWATGDRLSLMVAPVPWTAMAVARRCGNLEVRVAAAVGCQSAVPKPMSTLAAKAAQNPPRLPKSR